MMGDNVARCSMCKYDFQKASQGNNDEAAAEICGIISGARFPKERISEEYDAESGGWRYRHGLCSRDVG